MLKGIVILSLGIMMISSVMVLSFGVDDVFAVGKGTKKVFVSGIDLSAGGAKVKLAFCLVTSNVNLTPAISTAKGNGVVHVDLNPTNLGSPTTVSGQCFLPDNTPSLLFGPTDLQTHGPTKIVASFP